jgi:filamentous hemagglutinin family protein
MALSDMGKLIRVLAGRLADAVGRRLGLLARRAAVGCLLIRIAGAGMAQAADLPQVLTGVNARFEGAQLPVTTGNSMVINQFADKATLHWQSFDIGAGNSVEFRQPSASSVALNRIFDAAPSEVNGKLTANGQVYLINQNGIVFGDGAQVNTQSLVASTLDIDDTVYKEIGFVNAINAPQGALPAFDSFGRPMGEIHVAQGASLEAAQSGRILIFAPTIVNEGTISTPEGQQVLAAVTDKVLIAASEDPNLRGLLVEVSTGGDVTNLGSLIAERGNISLLGMAVNQQGVARATTSVSLNGSIRLRAQDMNGTLALKNDLVPRQPKPVRGGEAILGSGSVTEVVPDTSLDKDGKPLLAPDAQAQARSVVDIGGTRVRLEGGARVTSTGGDVSLIAAVNPGQPDLLLPGDPNAIAAELVLEAGSVVDASGDDSTIAPVERNVVSVEARGNELADSPLQRDGPIRNETLQVDSRRGTDFLNIDGAVAAIGRTAAERQSAGGNIVARSEGRIRLDEGARIDVSGGQVTYTGGLVSTSRLRQANGQVVEISSADPDVAYVGVVANAVSREDGYVEGKDAGTLTLQARGLELLGDIRAGSVPGVNQRQRPGALAAGTPVFARPYDQVPLGGRLALNLLKIGLPELIIGRAPPAPVAGAEPLVLTPEQIASWGAGRLGLGNAGPVIVSDALGLPAWTGLTLTGTQVSVFADQRIPGGDLTLNASNKVVGEAIVPDQDLLARIDAVVDLSGTWVNDNPLVNSARPTAPIVLDGGRLTINSGFAIEVSEASRLDVSAGAWRAANGAFTGGSGGGMAFVTGSNDLAVFSGAPLVLAGELRGFGFAGGGELSIETERVAIVPEATAVDDDDLMLDGSRQFLLREVADASGNRQFILDVGAGTFQQGGFGSFSLTSTRSDLEVTEGAAVRLRTADYLLTGSFPARAPTGTAVTSLATPVLFPDFQRRPAALSLSTNEDLANPIGPVADLRVAPGASITADAGSTIDLRSTTGVFLEGSVSASAGLINVELDGELDTFLPERKIWLGPGALLAANGTALIDTLDPLGLLRGEVRDAGRVTVQARQGSIVGAAGSRITVDGAVATLDTGFGGLPVRREVASAAGAIELVAAESLLYQGGLSGAAPSGFSVPGGWLTVSIDPTERGAPSLQGADRIPRGPHSVVMADFAGRLPGAGEAVDPEFYSTGFLPVEQLLTGGFSSLDIVARSSATGSDDDTGAPVPDTPQSVPVIRFPADLDLRLGRSIRLDAAILQTDAAHVSLAAPYVSIGHRSEQVRLEGSVPDKKSASNPAENTEPLRLTPAAGAGLLRVTAELIDLVGESVTEGFGDSAAGSDGVILDASGDVRMRGVRTRSKSDYTGLFRTAGNLTVPAGRVYPATLTSFELAAEGSGGRISFGRGGVDAVPLSVGGSLAVSADTIVQGGALFAPIGELELNAGSSLSFLAGSLTSTSAAGLATPFFRTEPGGALVLPAPSASEDQVVFVETVNNAEFERQLPEKRILLGAPAVDLQPGSRFDLRGGSEIAATEFVPGPGGSRDILLADLDKGAAVEANPSFAILPGIGGFAPHDPLESPAAEDVQGIRIGDTLVLEEGLPGLPAGEYALLPARYALFGGFLVTPEKQFQDLGPGQSLQRFDGAPILAGRFGVAGSDAAQSRSMGFAVQTGGDVRQRAEYLETPLDDFYSTGSLRAPRDAGRLVIEAGDSLSLRGELSRGSATGGLGSAVDLATTAALAVVSELTGINGIELRASDLVNLGADSLLLGGTRSDLQDGLAIDARSSEVTVAAGVELDLPELLLVGSRIIVDAAPGAATRLSSSGDGTASPTRVVLEEDAAVLAVSDRQLVLDRASAGSGSSSLAVAADASLEAGGGLILDAAGDVAAAGSLAVRGGTLNLGASRISVGETDGRSIDEGLVLSSADLTGIAGSDLRLRSNGELDIYGELPRDATGAPLAFQRLSIDARAIRGLANENRSAILAADTIVLGNSSGPSLTDPAPVAAAGSGLELRAGTELELGDGLVAVQGYAATAIDAASSIVLTGNGDLRVDGALTLATPVITAASATDSAITATGRLTVTAPGGSAAPAGPGLAAALALTAAEVNFAGRIDLPSGTVRLTQSGDAAAPLAAAGLHIGAAALIDVSGATLQFGPARIGTPGGAIVLTAQTGDLELTSGATLDASAGEGSEAGELRWLAPLGTVRFGSDVVIRGQDADQVSGRFLLDAASLSGSEASTPNPVTALAGLLEAGGFRASRALRLREQDMSIDAASAITARQIRLVADTGTIDVAGILDASGETAGSIWVAAADHLNITGTLRARSSADGSVGGRVDLYALDADGDDADGALGETVNLRAGSAIDVAGGPGGAGGELFVHARRLDSDADAQTDQLLSGELSGEITGAARAQLLATRILRDPSASQNVDPATGESVTVVSIMSADTESWRSETEIFLAGLSSPVAGALQIAPGLQVESSGDLVLLESWNFQQGWYFGQDFSDPTAPRPGVTGVVTLRAAGKVDLQADLSDAFTEQFPLLCQDCYDIPPGHPVFDDLAGPVSRFDASGAIVEKIVPQAWGYRIAAGADMASADALASGASVVALQLGAGARVRTGTADIDLSSSGDIRLGDGAAIYAAGWDIGLSSQLEEALAPAILGLTAYDFFVNFLDGGQFPVGGGTVTVAAGGDLVAAATPGQVSAWLPRIGSGQFSPLPLYTKTAFGAIPTHWALAFREFRNGIGSFGGGNLRIGVGGNVTNALLAAPTTGRVTDGVVADTTTFPGRFIFQPSERTTEILGGGDLDLRSGGELIGGQLVIGRGTAQVRTAGGSGAGGAPAFYLGGDATVDWISGGSVTLGGLTDPTVVALSATQLQYMDLISSAVTTTEDFDNRFFTYTDGSRVALSSLGGDVTFTAAGFGGFLPPGLTAAALGGDVNVVASRMEFYPGATATLKLLARDNISGNFPPGSEATLFRQSDQDAATLPSVNRPDLLPGAPLPAAVPVHTGDKVPNLIIARDGSIRSSPGAAGFWSMEFAKPAILQAGTDISNLSVRVQHIANDALSSFQAGRDIVQGDLRDNTGRFKASDLRTFEIWGPGSAEFVALRNISLGTSGGIESIGDTKNAALVSEGAALRLLAGTGGEPAYDRFIEVYLSAAPSAYRDEVNEFLGDVDEARAGYATSSEKTGLIIGPGEYARELSEFLEERGVAVVAGDPVATFRSLDRSVQRILLTDVMFAELSEWGTAAGTPDRADRLNYVRAYTALDTLFALEEPLGERAGAFAPGAIDQAIRSFLNITDAQAANDAQVALFGTLFPQGEPRGDISLLLSQVQTLAGGDLSMLAPGGDINAGAADADIIDKEPADLGIVTAQGGDIRIAVDNDLLVNSTRAFALQGDLLVWSSHGNIDAGKGAKTVTSVPSPVTRIDPVTGNTIIVFPPAVSGSGLQGENAALFAPRGSVNAGDAGIRTSGDLTIGAVEIVGADNIDVGGVEIGFSSAEAVAVAPPGAASASSAATKGMESEAGMLSEANEEGERTITGTEVTFISVEVLSFGDDNCDSGEQDCR